MKYDTVSILVRSARSCARDARRSRRQGSRSHADWNEGRVSAFLLAARQVKGWETWGRGVNYNKRHRVAA